LMRLFGSERIAKVMDKLGFEDGERIESSMISNSIVDDQVSAFKANKIPQTQQEVDRINKLVLTQNIFQGVTIALGVNYFIQLIIYLIKADRALPRKIKPDYASPVYKEPVSDKDVSIENKESKNEE